MDMGTLTSSIRDFAALILALSPVLPLQAAKSAESPAKKAKKPNIILFLVDDMGWVDSEPYGSKYYDMPNMRRLADQGMRFTKSYAHPVCSRTRASILTGQHSARHGVTSAVGHTPPAEAKLPETATPNRPAILPESKTFLDPSQYTLAEALHDVGYRTGHFGKWHLGLTPPHWPEKQGFDVAFHAEPSAGPPNAYFSPCGVLPPPTDQTDKTRKRSFCGTVTDGEPGEHITPRLTDEALEFVQENKSRSFFLNLWHFGVHGSWGHKESITAEMAKRTDPTGRQDNPVMASMLKSVDESLGRILDEIEAQGLADNTIIVFASDNGGVGGYTREGLKKGGNTHSMTEAIVKERGNDEEAGPDTASYRRWAGFKPPTNNAPPREGKGKLHEGGIRVPLMVRWPGKIAAKSTSDAVVGCIDSYPTLLDLAGIAPNPEQKMDGISFAPELLGTGKFPRDTYIVWYPHGMAGVAVRRGDWKLIRHYWKRPTDWDGLRELYNLSNDLGEQNNLAEKMPDKVKELDALIDEFLKDTGALVALPKSVMNNRGPESKQFRSKSFRKNPGIFPDK